MAALKDPCHNHPDNRRIGQWPVRKLRSVEGVRGRTWLDCGGLRVIQRIYRQQVKVKEVFDCIAAVFAAGTTPGVRAGEYVFNLGKVYLNVDAATGRITSLFVGEGRGMMAKCPQG
jgi:hypothetical protein